MPNKRNDWAEIKTHVGPEGRILKEFLPQGKDGKSTFRGMVLIVERSADPRIPPMQRNFEFRFEEGVTKKQCCNVEFFDKHAQDAIRKEMDRRHEQNRIVAAQGVPKTPILGPNGKPTGGI